MLPAASIVAPPRVGRQFGGSSDSSEDEGADLDVWVSGVSNPDRVLRFGARPSLQEVGPIRFRSYLQPVNVTTSGAAASFLARRFLVHMSGDLDEQIVVPSVAFRYVEEFLKTRSDIVVQSFEDGVTPLLFASEATRLRQELPSRLRAGFFPELAERAVLSAARHAANGSTHTVLEHWRLGEDVLGSPHGKHHSFVLPRRALAQGQADPGPITAVVSNVLWAYSSPWSFLNVQRSTPVAVPPWRQIYASGAPSDSDVISFANYFKVFDARYRNSSVARVHLTQLVQWVSESVATSGARAEAFEKDAARALHDLGLLPRAAWSLVTAAQLAQCAVSGLAFWVRNLRHSGPVRNLNETAGPLLLNTCPRGTALTGGGASLADYEELDWRPAAAPELSCLPYREGSSLITERPPSELAALAAGTAEVSLSAAVSVSTARFRSKVAVDEMVTILEELTSGASMTPFRIPGSRVTATLMRNARNLKAAPTVANNVVDTALSRVTGSEGALYWVEQLDQAKITIEQSPAGSTAAASAAATIAQASARYQQHLSSQDVSLVNSICSTTYLPPQLRNSVPLSCYQILDVTAWVNHVARTNVWFPRLVSEDPSTGRPAAGVLRSGPLVRMSVRDALFGYEDSLYRLLFGAKYPGMGPPNDGAASFAAKSGRVSRVHVATGSAELSDVGQVRQYGPDRKGVLTWSDISPATGAYSTKRTAGIYDRAAQSSPPGLPEGKLSVWNDEMQRPVSYALESVRPSKGNLVNVWYVREEPATSWPYFTSDRTADSPFCLRSLSQLPGPDGVATGVKLFLGKPRFLDCSAGEQSLGYSLMASPANATDSSAWEVEPVTGLVASAVKRWATYLRWGPSTWYPFLRPTIAPLVRFEERRQANEAALRAIREEVDLVNYQVDTAIPVALGLLGTIALLQAVVFVLVIFYPPREPVGADERRKRRKEFIAQAREERLKKAAAEKRVLQEQQKVSKLEKAVHKPGSVLMSSVLGSVASSPASGIRGAPSFHAASAAALSSKPSAKVRPWQRPLPSTGALSPTGTGQPTDVLTFGGSARLPHDSKTAPGDRATTGRSIMGMSLSQAMNQSSSNSIGEQSTIVETPDGKSRRKKVKRGSQTMSMSPKRRRPAAPAAPPRPARRPDGSASPGAPAGAGAPSTPVAPGRPALAMVAEEPEGAEPGPAAGATPDTRRGSGDVPQGSPDSDLATPPLDSASKSTVGAAQVSSPVSASSSSPVAGESLFE